MPPLRSILTRGARGGGRAPERMSHETPVFTGVLRDRGWKSHGGTTVPPFFPSVRVRKSYPLRGIRCMRMSSTKYGICCKRNIPYRWCRYLASACSPCILMSVVPLEYFIDVYFFNKFFEDFGHPTWVTIHLTCQCQLQGSCLGQVFFG